MSLQVGQLIEQKYRILRLIGQGGMGAVFEGENVLIHRRVAIKILIAGRSSAEAIQRFEREAQAAGRIGSDHILEVLDLGTLATGERFIVMEYLDGESLGARIHRLGHLTPEQIAPIARQMVKGLVAAHAAGIIHRDLKPENVFILREKAGQADFVKLIDFGVSKFQSTALETMDMTRTGAVMGTPYYMSPEQAKGGSAADVRNDLYAIGVIMFEAVTGRVPFDASTFNELLFKIVLSDAPPVRSVVPDIDPSFATIIETAMAKAPENRYQTSAALLAALDGWIRAHLGRTPMTSDASLSGAVVAPARSLVGTTPIGAPQIRSTAETWANSNAPSTPPARSKAIAAASAAAFVALAVVGGAAFGLYRYVTHRASVETSAVGSAASIRAIASDAVEAPIAAPPVASIPSDVASDAPPAAPASSSGAAPPVIVPPDLGAAARASSGASSGAPPSKHGVTAPAQRSPSRAHAAPTSSPAPRPASTTPDFGY